MKTNMRERKSNIYNNDCAAQQDNGQRFIYNPKGGVPPAGRSIDWPFFMP